MILMAWIFLGVPDFDLALLPILHHRSIVTHSILPPLLFLLVARRLGAAPIAGAMIGTSVHLTCDLLSPMVGFAQIWLPAPIKAPLGPLSYLWLLGNALVGYVVAFGVAYVTLPRGIAFPFIIALSAMTGAAYGALNEQSVLSVIVCLVFPTLAGVVAWRRSVKGNSASAAKAEG
ncbi:hypothetical protein [Tropicibacter naphthalenivorans]|nr:hypothetical protein [Tropicibacter naphthalenivorans]